MLSFSTSRRNKNEIRKGEMETKSGKQKMYNLFSYKNIKERLTFNINHHDQVMY